MNRRTFLKIAGMGSIAFATGCTQDPEKFLFSLVQAPDDMVTGKATWYASTCRECPAGCGVLAKNREGRVIKLEGNPYHPVNKGKLCMRGQAALQRVYDPDRIKHPLLKVEQGWRRLELSQARKLMKEKAEAAAKNGPNRVRMLTEIEGQALLTLFSESLAKWRSSGPLVFEPFAYDSLKVANEKVFGLKGLFSYNMQNADFLISFGADFLETWLSPVEYAQKFKAMHALKNGKKNLFFQVSPIQSLTGTNADAWIPCHPGGETAVVFGLINESLKTGNGRHLPASFLSAVAGITATYTSVRVAELSGIPAEQYQSLVYRLMDSQAPLILGTGTGSPGANDLQTNTAVNLLNLILDPELKLFDFENRHRVEIAAERSEVTHFFKALEEEPVDLLLLNNTNPVYTLPPGSRVKEVLNKASLFVISFSNFMDETTQHADLILPTALPLETWGEYQGKSGIESTLQPAMGRLTKAPDLGDVFLESAFGKGFSAYNFKTYLFQHFIRKKHLLSEKDWIKTLQQGGTFEQTATGQRKWNLAATVVDTFDSISGPLDTDMVFMAVPSIRYFDGRGANLSWMSEIPDPLTKIAWQTPVLMHPQAMAKNGLSQSNIVEIRSKWGRLEALVYETKLIRPNLLVMGLGQGHDGYGRYAKGQGLNPVLLFSPNPGSVSEGSGFSVYPVAVKKTGRSIPLAHTDGSRIQHGRKIALSVSLDELKQNRSHEKHGLTMHDFPFTSPLPEGYDSKRDFYPGHDHETYRWGMIVDLDRCIGCAACAAACYAENNLGVVGMKRMIEGREMSWLSVERYHNPDRMEKTIFFPMLCQHCDNAPCESVCPVYAPHHSKEGLNNQIYNRCIGTRFCSQNCPYKVRRFNWFDWERPDPLHLQLNPNVTVRSKGVMEKCSFCVQRIKDAHDVAKNENRMIRDGEVIPACVQTCPTGALSFGNLMDKKSRVRNLMEDPRAYQAMGYLNTKPAVVYLKKVTQEV